MSKYKFKGLAKRGAAFAMAVGLLSGVAISAFPSLSFADALNPLTERTLLLSSSSPGYHYLDAAGNPDYAAPGSGPNGKQSGETFAFKVSTNSSSSGFGAKDTAIQAFTFQYCTTAAGDCTAPGDNATDAIACTTAPATPCTDTDHTSDLNVNYPSPLEVSTIPSVSPTGASLVPRDNTGGNFAVIVGGVLETGWTLTTDSVEATATTGHQNFITLVNGVSTVKPAAGTQVDIVFYPTDTNYITNPGSGAFFVKINDYSSDTDVDPLTSTSIIDGGVTVANVMTDSIQIQTKVLETMSFSVGTINPDTVTLTAGSHGPCDSITVNAPIDLGNTSAENSLEVNTAYDGHSFWRLSSNSSNGASVYYSGYTLSNTVGDQINAMTTEDISHPGMEQFGLAFDTEDTPLDQTAGGHGVADTNTLTPLASAVDYDEGSGSINTSFVAKFTFKPSSASTPELLASEGTDVVGCTTGKMRYLGNIAAATPAGIYSSKVNYLAAPQY